jgi:hypothetical protein
MPEDTSRLTKLEARLIEAGSQAIRDGRYIDDADLDAWLDGLEGDPDLEASFASERAIQASSSTTDRHPRDKPHRL